MEAEACLRKDLAKQLPQEVIERQFFGLAIGKQPVPKCRVAFPNHERNPLLDLGIDRIEGGEPQIPLSVDDLRQKLGADQVEPRDGLHQRIGHIEARRVDAPLGMGQRGECQKRLAGRFITQRARRTMGTRGNPGLPQPVHDREAQRVRKKWGKDDDFSRWDIQFVNQRSGLGNDRIQQFRIEMRCENVDRLATAYIFVNDRGIGGYDLLQCECQVLHRLRHHVRAFDHDQLIAQLIQSVTCVHVAAEEITVTTALVVDQRRGLEIRQPVTDDIVGAGAVLLHVVVDQMPIRAREMVPDNVQRPEHVGKYLQLQGEIQQVVLQAVFTEAVHGDLSVLVDRGAGPGRQSRPSRAGNRSRHVKSQPWLPLLRLSRICEYRRLRSIVTDSK